MRTQSRPGRTRALRWIGALSAAAVLALAAGPALAAVEPFEKLVPEGATVYISVKSVPQLLGKIRSSPQYKLWSEPAMQPIKEELTGAFEEMRATVAKAIGTEPEQLERVLAGQVSLAILPRGDRDAHFLLLADVSGDPKAAEAMLQSLLKYTRDEQGGYAIKEETFRGHTIYCIEPLPQPEPEQAPATAPAVPGPWEDEAAPAPAGPPDEEWNEEWPVEGFRPYRRTENPGFITLSGGILAVASSPDRSLIEKHLVLREGGDVASLSGGELYRRLSAHMGAQRDLTLFVDMTKLSEEEEGGPLGPDLGAALRAMPGLGCGVTLAEDGVAVDGLLLAPAPRSGFLRPFASQAGTVMPPAFVGKEAGILVGAHFDAFAMWEEITAAIQRESPDEYIQFQQGVRGLKFDLENDVLKALGTRWFVYLPGPSGGEQDGMDGALCADLRDSPAFSRALPLMLADLPEFMKVNTVDFMGVKIYTLTMSFGPEEAGEPSVCLAVLPDKAVYASGLDLMKTIIKDDQREASPLLADAEFQRLLGRTMDNPDALLLLDGRVIAQWVLQQVEHQRRMAEEFRADAEVPAEAPTPEPSKMPPVELLKRYGTSHLLTAKWTDEGLVIKGWTPHPKLEQ